MFFRITQPSQPDFKNPSNSSYRAGMEEKITA